MKRTKQRILAIQGSHRKDGKTTEMLNFAVEEARRQGHEVNVINLFEKKIGFCRGCRKCDELKECIFKNDDMPEITKAMNESDVILLAAPVYWGNMPAIVKNMLDRMVGASMEETKTFPKPRLKGKRYILLTACNTRMPFAKLCGQSSGIQRALKEYFSTSGIRKIGTVICDNSGNCLKVPPKKLEKIRRLITKI